LPIYPLVVTLEEWYLFSPLTTAYVHRQVKALLERSCIDPRVADDMPYTVASIDEMELVGQIFDRTGLGTFFARKTESTHRHTMLAGFAWTCFEEHMRYQAHLVLRRVGAFSPRYRRGLDTEPTRPNCITCIVPGLITGLARGGSRRRRRGYRENTPATGEQFTHLDVEAANGRRDCVVGQR
jgi:hypothetical protein